MPTLDFKGKQFVYAHHLTVPFRQLSVDAAKSLPANGQKPDLGGNLIIHGDNLHALKALLPKYAGKIKCIYIDPPYNTGNEGWCYNDKVNAPLIREWLKKEVNPVDKEDLERHDKWLCMMWPRLQLLRELLADDGVIFVSIDDIERSNLEAILDEIFQPANKLNPFIWELPRGINAGFVARSHEYVLAYAKNVDLLRKFYRADDGKEYSIERCNKKIDRRHPASTITIPAGLRYEGKDAVLKGKIQGNEEITIEDELVFKDGKLAKPARLTAGWTMKNFFEKWIKGEKVLDTKGQEIVEFFFKESGRLYSKKEMKFEATKSVLKNIPDYQDARDEIDTIMFKDVFEYPKPPQLVKKLVSLLTSDDDVILDSFAGSGTTAHAVLALNKEDGGNRKFILVEMEDYADKVTAERARRVIKGVPSAKDDNLKAGLGGSFTYCILGDEINIENLLKGEKLPSYEDLARYAFYTATGQTLDKVKQDADYLVGETANYRVHVIYKPDLEFLRSKDSALNMALAERIGKSRGKSGKTALVFAAHKFMGQKELKDLGITFCQLPYAIHRITGD